MSEKRTSGSKAELHSAPRTEARRRMVARQIRARGVSDPAVLQAMEEVPRDRFVPPEAVEFAHHDAPLSIGEGQTISQPYMVALMAEAAEVGPGDRVMEVGTGSGYGAAVLSRIASQVFTVERHRSLAESAQDRFGELGYDNIQVRCADGTLGWPEEAPFDAIVVTAGAPAEVPPALIEQLAPGGRLIIPAGITREGQELLRIRRSGDGKSLDREALMDVRFVPLIGTSGWSGDRTWERRNPARSETAPAPRDPSRLMADSAQPFDSLESVDLESFLDRVGASRLVLLGEATHGTSEFYRLRARITRELIEKRGFDFVAIEADWPDAAELDAYVRHHPGDRPRRKPFQRFPRWMWGNREMVEFVHWLRDFNAEFREVEPGRMVGLHGLDLYSMNASIDVVLGYLDDVDPEAAALARQRYGCLSPWQNDPILYGRASLSSSFDACEDKVMAILRDLLEQSLEYARRNGSRYLDAVQNARLVASAEKYYRKMYRGSVASWNLRDQHMFDTLELLLSHYGPESRGVIWAHNSHLGDASATAMGERGEFNVGQLAREALGRSAFLVGFGTHQGTVAAARDWGAPMEVMDVRPSHPRSYEHLAHSTGIERFFLPFRDREAGDLHRTLSERRLARAIGVIYRPDAELQSHYFPASLPRQFDEWIWLNETRAVTPLSGAERKELVEEGILETYPFGL